MLTKETFIKQSTVKKFSVLLDDSFATHKPEAGSLKILFEFSFSLDAGCDMPKVLCR